MSPHRAKRSADVHFLFKDFVLDPDRRELTQDANDIAIGPQVFDLLLYLVQNRDRVVSKDDMLEAVWGGRIVSESTLTSHINAVRKAIGDTDEEQQLVRTIPRKGFHFIGDVSESAGSNNSSHNGAGTSAVLPFLLPLPNKPAILRRAGLPE
jgi:DNA-binding winged helix-turn-helix (wHTH) protein